MLALCRATTRQLRIATTLCQARQQLQQMQPLVTRVLARSRARLLGGDTHVPDKVLSIVGLGVIAANLVSTAHVLNPATA